MARDRNLLFAAERGEACARIYRWSEPTVSLGMSQHPDRDLISRDALPWVMRPTGGKAVLHGHDETVGLAVPLFQLGVGSRSVRDVYRIVIQPLLDALRASGHDAELGERTTFSGAGKRTADCFAHVSANDIVNPNTGVKVCGCALRLTDRAVLVQASVPNGPPLVDPHLIFAKPAPITSATWDASRFAEHLSRALDETEWF